MITRIIFGRTCIEIWQSPRPLVGWLFYVLFAGLRQMKSSYFPFGDTFARNWQYFKIVPTKNFYLSTESQNWLLNQNSFCYLGPVVPKRFVSCFVLTVSFFYHCSNINFVLFPDQTRTFSIRFRNFLHKFWCFYRGIENFCRVLLDQKMLFTCRVFETHSGVSLPEWASYTNAS